MTKVACKDCRHFREAPYQAPRTGCWHPDHVVARQKEAFLDEQQLPGDHRKINLRGDCGQWERRAPRPSLLKRILRMGA